MFPFASGFLKVPGIFSHGHIVGGVGRVGGRGWEQSGNDLRLDEALGTQEELLFGPWLAEGLTVEKIAVVWNSIPATHPAIREALEALGYKVYVHSRAPGSSQAATKVLILRQLRAEVQRAMRGVVFGRPDVALKRAPLWNWENGLGRCGRIP